MGERSVADARFAWVVALGLWSLLAAVVAAELRPPQGLWGLVGWLALPAPLRIAVCAVLATLALPPAASAMVRRVRGVASRVGVTLRRVPVGLWIALLVAVSWLLRSSFTVGDGAQTVALLEAGELINTKEPLDRLITAAVYRSGHWLLAWDAATAIAVVSTAAGAVFWLAVARLGRRHPIPSLGAWPWWLLLGTTGATALFCGHVENYSLLTAATLWTLVLALEAAQEPDRSLWPAALALGISVAVHLAAVWLAPALVVAWWERARARELGGGTVREAVWGFAVSLLPLVCVVTAMWAAGFDVGGFSLATFGGGDGTLFVPLRETSTPFESYTMFSAEHLSAFANELLLVAPVGMLVALATALRGSDSTQGGRGARLLLAATVGTLAYALLFNPDMMVFYPSLGALAEWDLFAFLAVPVTVLGLWQVRNGWPATDLGNGALAAAAAVSTVHGLAWIAFNATVTL